MKNTERTLSLAQSWEPGATLDVWLDTADYAVLTPAGVALALEDHGGFYDAVLLRLEEEGVDADTGLALYKDSLQEKLQNGRWEITKSWPMCEAHLRAGRVAAQCRRESL